MWTRTGAALISYLATGAFLFLDLQGIKIDGQTVEWQIPALISLLIFGGLVSWHIFSLNQQIHSPENQLDVIIRPDPPIEDEWYKITTTEGTHTHRIWAYLHIDMRNLDSVDRTVNEIYLELKPARRLWGWPLLRRTIAKGMPSRVDYNLDWYKRERRAQVDWTIPVGGQTETHGLSFEYSWESETGKLPKWVNLYLVIEVGGRFHKRYFDLEEVKVD